MSANASSIADLLAAAELSEPRPFGELISRLTADGRLRGARDGGRAIGPAALAGIEVRGITDDSRKVGRGALFVAVPGLHVDGHDFVAAAARAGAVAALVERPVVDVTLPQLVVDRAPRALADAAAWWYGDPSRHLGIVGITGTDGKTTTCFLAIAALYVYAHVRERDYGRVGHIAIGYLAAGFDHVFLVLIVGVDSFLLTPGPGGGAGGFFNTSFWAELPHRFTGNVSWASFFLAALYAVRVGLTDDPVERSYRAWAAKASLLVGFLVLVPQVLGGVFFVELIRHGQPAAFAHSFMGPQAWMWMVQVSLLSLLLVGSSLYFALSRRGTVGIVLAGLVLAAGVVSALPPAAFDRLFWVRYVALAAAILLSLAAWLAWLRRERQLELVAPARAALAVTGVAAVALLLLMGVIRSSARDPYTVYGRLDQQHSQAREQPGPAGVDELHQGLHETGGDGRRDGHRSRNRRR